MYVVIGHDRLKGLLGANMLDHWFVSYIQLLQRFRLFNEATQVSEANPLWSEIIPYIMYCYYTTLPSSDNSA